jgi:hypothetical protein
MRGFKMTVPIHQQPATTSRNIVDISTTVNVNSLPETIVRNNAKFHSESLTLLN